MRVLVTGGAGQLGGFLVRELAAGARVAVGRGSAALPLRLAYTFRGSDLAGAEEFGDPDADGWRSNNRGNSLVKAFKVDLADGEGLEACVREVRPDIVINAAAIARPKLCEDEPERARAVNVPTKLVEALEAAGLQKECVVVHISTDLVYDGASSELFAETAATNAVNMYGQSKVEAEALLAARWPAHIALRSSMIYGRAPKGDKCSFFTEFVDQRLRDKAETDFFVDEFRSPIYIGDFLAVVQAVMARLLCARAARLDARTALEGLRQTYNFGGPDRLSRYEMAMQVCAHNKHDPGLIKEAVAASFDRGVKSPLDTGMDSSQIAADLQIDLTSFARGLDLAFPSQTEASS